MRRKQFMIDLNEIYNKNMKTELKLNVDIVNTTLGLIEIIPIEAINLSHLKNPLYVKLSYGDDSFNTQSLSTTISDTSIKLNGLSIDYMFRTWYEITTTLREHYLNAALEQIYRIVGSLDLVNSPVSLLSSLGVGVRDFFYEPAYALISHPTEITKIGKGVVKGAVSLASNTADGIIGTTTVMTRSVGKGISYFARDELFLANREKLQRQPENMSEIVLRPFQDVGNGLYCGVIGIVRLPYQDVKKFGFPGLFTGLGKGIAGLGAKPIIGVLDAVTHTGDGLRYFMKSLNPRQTNLFNRQRYPSIFGIDGRLLPYDNSSGLGAFILYLIDLNMK